MSSSTPRPWGLLAEFRDERSLVEAIERMRESGFRDLDAFCPYPSEAVTEALDLGRGRTPGVFLLGALCGGSAAYALQYYSAVHAYPWNVGGKPLHSWPMFIPITFELTILGAALFGVIALFWQCGFPRLYHPLFHSERFERSSMDGFFLALEATDPKFTAERDTRTLLDLGAVAVEEVEP
jgi:hypothetical protein